MTTTSRTHPSISHHRAEVNGVRLYYLSAGSGDPLVLLHGFPETSYAWRKVIPTLAERFHVIAPICAAAAPPIVPITATTNAPSPRTSTSSSIDWSWGRSTSSAMTSG